MYDVTRREGAAELYFRGHCFVRIEASDEDLLTRLVDKALAWHVRRRTYPFTVPSWFMHQKTNRKYGIIDNRYAHHIGGSHGNQNDI